MLSLDELAAVQGGPFSTTSKKSGLLLVNERNVLQVQKLGFLGIFLFSNDTVLFAR